MITVFIYAISTTLAIRAASNCHRPNTNRVELFVLRMKEILINQNHFQIDEKKRASSKLKKSPEIWSSFSVSLQTPYDCILISPELIMFK